MNAELKPCPFCGAPLQGEIDDGAAFHAHPKSDCWFSEWEFDAINVEQWNRRANELPPGAVPIPASVNMGRLMLGLGYRYLQENAPEHLARTTSPSPSTAPTDEAGERAAFEAWMKSGPDYPFASTFSNMMWGAWKARAALAAKPAKE